MTLKSRIDLIEKALDVCVDTDISDSYKAGYCESLLVAIHAELTALENDPELKSRINSIYGRCIEKAD